MLDIGWTELLVIAVVLIVVVGPHDLPKVMRAIAELYGKARAMANRFRADMDALAREVELEELRRKVKLYEFQNPRREMTKLLGVDPNERIALDDDLPGAPVPAAAAAPAGDAPAGEDAGEAGGASDAHEDGASAAPLPGADTGQGTESR